MNRPEDEYRCLQGCEDFFTDLGGELSCCDCGASKEETEMDDLITDDEIITLLHEKLNVNSGITLDDLLVRAFNLGISYGLAKARAIYTGKDKETITELAAETMLEAVKKEPVRL